MSLTQYLPKMFTIWIIVIAILHNSAAIPRTTSPDSSPNCTLLLCQNIDELFTDTNLDVGYNYVATLPKGAFNVTIKQMVKTSNLIALKTFDEKFIINGNKEASESGVYHYHKDSFDYDKDKGLVTSKGPLTKPVVLMLLAYAVNSGLRYKYTLAVPTASSKESPEATHSHWNVLGQPLDVYDKDNHKKHRQFSWKLLGFGPCNRYCGPGIQPPIFRCIRDSPTRYYNPRRCTYIEKPQFNEDIYHCNRALCPAYWRERGWTSCECFSDSMENGYGKRKRLLECVQEQASGEIEKVEEKNCSNDNKPTIAKEMCKCPQVVKRQLHIQSVNGTLEKFSRIMASPVTHKRIVAAKHGLKINSTKTYKPGVWLMSDWNQQCANDCDINFEHRSIYCDRTAPYTDLCDIRSTPTQKRPCTTRSPSKCSHGIWFTSEWSKCTGECFNLQRKRIILCVLDDKVVEESLCKVDEKPEAIRNCTYKEVDFCQPKWHYSEWSECSRSCGEGVQRRYAKCLDYDWKQNILIESNKCKYKQREPVYGVCNVDECDDDDIDDVDDDEQEELLMENTAEHFNDIKTVNSKMIKSAKELLRPIRRYSLIPRKMKPAEKLVIAAAPITIKNCNDELNNCKRINRERLCKLNYFKTFCCLTCYGYY